MTRARRFAIAAAVAAAVASAPEARASHFRYGTIRWEVTGETATTIDLKVTAETAWRCAYYAIPCSTLPPVVLTQYIFYVERISDGATLRMTTLDVEVTAVNAAEDWFIGTTIKNFTGLPRSGLPFLVYWWGASRYLNLQDGNSNQNFRVESVVTRDAATSGGNAASPVSSILPMITIAHGLPAAKFFIPAADVEGDALGWSISPRDRSYLFKPAPDGADDAPPDTLSIDPATGEVTWDTSQEQVPPVDGDLYSAQFMVRDSKGGEAAVDALLRLVPQAGAAPRALIDGSTSPGTFSTRPGRPVSFAVTGDDADPNAVVTLTSGGLPAGATMTPSLPYAAASPVSSTFEWTPTPAQVGNAYVVSFAATDDEGQQDTNSVRITVLANRAPSLTCPGPRTVEATGPAGAPAALATTVDDPDDDPLAVRWSVDGTLAETDLVANPPATVDHAQTYALGAHPVRIEVDDAAAPSVACDTAVEVVDTTGPVLTLPADIVVPATGPGGAVVSWPPPTAVDLVDGSHPVTCSPPSGSTFPIGTTIVSCTAADSRGNASTGTFRATVLPVAPLPVVVTLDPALLWPPNHRMVRIAVAAQAPPGAVCAIAAVTSNEPVEGTGDGDTAPDWTFSGLQLELRSERSGQGNGRVYTVTVSCTDAGGNVGTGTATAVCPHDHGAALVPLR